MSPILYQVLLAIFYIGATAVFMDAWSDKKRLENACKLSGIQAFIGPPLAHLLRIYSKTIRQIPLHLITGYHAFKPQSKLLLRLQETETSDVALITFSTGSTGIPKGAKRTHGYLLAQHRSLRLQGIPEPDDIDMPLLPIFVLNNLAAGVTSVLPHFDPRKPERADPEIIMAEIMRYQVTSTTGSPLFYEKMAAHCLKNSLSPSSLKKIFLGGAPVFPRLAKQLSQAFPDTRITIVYGSTEAEPVSLISVPEFLRQQPDIMRGLLVGKPVPDIELKIFSADQNYHELPVNQIGEICVTGDHVLKAYDHNPEAEKATKFSLNGKIWHRTGDAGYLDDTGNLYLLGRVNQRFWWQDQWIYPFPLENQLLEIPGIQIGTILQKEQKMIIAIELNPHYSQKKLEIEKQIQLLNPSHPIKFLKKIPRDPRHHSKIDYPKLLNLI